MSTPLADPETVQPSRRPGRGESDADRRRRSWPRHRDHTPRKTNEARVFSILTPYTSFAPADHVNAGDHVRICGRAAARDDAVLRREVGVALDRDRSASQSGSSRDTACSPRTTNSKYARLRFIRQTPLLSPAHEEPPGSSVLDSKGSIANAVCRRQSSERLPLCHRPRSPYRAMWQPREEGVKRRRRVTCRTSHRRRTERIAARGVVRLDVVSCDDRSGPSASSCRPLPSCSFLSCRPQRPGQRRRRRPSRTAPSVAAARPGTVGSACT